MRDVLRRELVYGKWKSSEKEKNNNKRRRRVENGERNGRVERKKGRMKKEGGKKELHLQRWKRKWEGKESILDPTVWAWEGRKTSVYCRVFCKKHEEVLWAGKESFLFIHSICLQYMLKGEEDQGSLSLPHHRVWCLPLPLHLPWTLWNSHWWWVTGNQNSSFGFSCFFLPGQDSPETCPICAPIGSSFWNYGSSFCQVFCNAWDYFGLLLFVASGQPAQYLQQFVPEVNDIAWRGLVKMVSLFLLYYYWNPHGVLEMLSWHIIADWAAMMPCCKFYFMWYFRAVWWWLVFVEIVLMECYCLCKYFSIASCRKLHKYAPGFWINIVPKKQ